MIVSFLTLSDMLSFSLVSKRFYKSVYKSNEVWWRFARMYLTDDDDVIQRMKENKKSPRSEIERCGVRITRNLKRACEITTLSLNEGYEILFEKYLKSYSKRSNETWEDFEEHVCDVFSDLVVARDDLKMFQVKAKYICPDPEHAFICAAAYGAIEIMSYVYSEYSESYGLVGSIYQAAITSFRAKYDEMIRVFDFIDTIILGFDAAFNKEFEVETMPLAYNNSVRHMEYLYSKGLSMSQDMFDNLLGSYRSNHLESIKYLVSEKGLKFDKSKHICSEKKLSSEEMAFFNKKGMKVKVQKHDVGSYSSLFDMW